VFYVIRLSTRAYSDRKNLTPTRHQKQNGLFMGFPVTFTRSKSRLRTIPGNQASYRPHEPGNQAPGRSASMLTRTASCRRYSDEFRSPRSTSYDHKPDFHFFKIEYYRIIKFGLIFSNGHKFRPPMTHEVLLVEIKRP
jgi:hypothetical protein